MKVYVVAHRDKEEESGAAFDWSPKRSLTEMIYETRKEDGWYKGRDHALFSIEVDHNLSHDETTAYVQGRVDEILSTLIKTAPAKEKR